MIVANDNYKKSMIGNIYAGIPAFLPEEIISVLAKSKDVRVERIVSKGQTSPDGFWYDQEKAEFVLLLRGEAEIEFEGEGAPVFLGCGDYLVIPPHVRHRVTRTLQSEETIWLAVHY